MADYYDLELHRAARQVCEALSEYVTILEESSGRPDQVVAGMDRVAAACGAFVERSIDTTGWGNPFLPSTEPEEEDELSALSSGAGEVVELSTQYLIRCPDPIAADQFVRSHLRERGVPIVEDEIDTVVDMVGTLHDLDGWRPHRYTHESRPVFELIGLSWQVEPRS